MDGLQLAMQSHHVFVRKGEKSPRFPPTTSGQSDPPIL